MVLKWGRVDTGLPHAENTENEDYQLKDLQFLTFPLFHFSTFPLLTFSIFKCHGLDDGKSKSINTSELSYNF